MFEFLSMIADSSGFMLHSHCMTMSKATVFLHLIGDLVIGVAYYVISFTLLYLKKKVKVANMLDGYIFMFIVFIFCCGTGHFLDAYTLIISPIYRLEGVWHIITALVSLGTAVLLILRREFLIDAGRAISIWLESLKAE